MPLRRPDGTIMKGGGSLNPGGQRKKVRELCELARESMPKVFAFALRVVDDEAEDTRTRLDAGKFLASYGLGTPPRVEADGDGDAAHPQQVLTIEEMRALARMKLTSEMPVASLPVGAEPEH